MIVVSSVVEEPGRLSFEAGRIHFYAVPAHSEDEFVCHPPGVTPEATKAISVELARTPPPIQGTTGPYPWRKCD
jgi:hypothetical protein